MERMGASWSGSIESLRDYKNIPATTLTDLIQYVVTGRAHGDFIRAVVNNDLMGAFNHADLANIKALWAITTWVYNRMPMAARDPKTWQGLAGFSPAVVDEWKRGAVLDTVLE